MCLAARGVSLDILDRNVQAGRNGNKHAMVRNRQGVLMAAAAGDDDGDASVAAADASAAAAANGARGDVKPTAADDISRETAKPTGVDDDVDGLCRRACRDQHCHGLRDPLESRRRAPGRCLAALHLWPGHGCRRHF